MQEVSLKAAGKFSGMQLRWLPSQAKASMWTRSEQGETQQGRSCCSQCPSHRAFGFKNAL